MVFSLPFISNRDIRSSQVMQACRKTTESSKQRQANDLNFAGINLKIFTFFNWNISNENILPVTFGEYNPKTDNKDTI